MNWSELEEGDALFHADGGEDILLLSKEGAADVARWRWLNLGTGRTDQRVPAVATARINGCWRVERSAGE